MVVLVLVGFYKSTTKTKDVIMKQDNIYKTLNKTYYAAFQNDENENIQLFIHRRLW